MNTCDFKLMLQKALLGETTLQEFADELSRSWLCDELFDDPNREKLNGHMNKDLFEIIEWVFESGEAYNPEFVKKGAKFLIGDDEFLKDILLNYEKLIIFMHENPEYRCKDE